jgi:type I restriction enzyme S subunit
VDKLTQSILAKAFRGELVPQDPNDEPASELLKRIQEERRKQDLGSQPDRKGSKQRGKTISSTL